MASVKCNFKSLSVQVTKSFGIIPFRKNEGEWEVLVIQQKSGHWCFCKGRAEPGDQSELQTAIRELKEETNLDLKRTLSGESFEEFYEFERKGIWKKKTVKYWIGEVADDSILKLQSSEVAAALWLHATVASNQLTHSQSKDVLYKVIPVLDSIAA